MPSTNTLAKAALVEAFITPLLEPLNDVGLGAGSAKGQTVRYVSPTSSGPSATGTQADPWSLAELQTAINNDLIPANTEVRFERDQVFEGTLTIDDLNGTEGSPIKFLADPTSSGALPIFSGSKVVPANSWTSYATSPTEIWQVHLNTIGVSDVFNVYDGGELMTVAREPDAGFHRATTFSPGSGTLTSDDLASDPIDWTGGGVLVIRHVNWSYMNRVVTSDAGTSIGYPAISANTGGTDWGFYLQNKLEALDTPGEWYLAGAGGSDPVLYYAPLTSGQPQNVRIAVRQRGIQVWPTGSGCSYLEFRDLVFEHYADAYYRLNSDPNPLGVGIKIKSGSHHITVDHCTFRDLRIGIDDQDNPENRPHHNNYTNNTFERIYRNALKLNSDVATVQYNSITEVGRWSGQAGNDYGGNTALFSTGDDVDISWNTLSELGGAGIGLNGMRLTATRHIVEHNSIRNASLDLNDHGAITFDKCEALTIRYNVIDGMQPFTASSATDGNSSDRTVGIYFGEGRIVDVHVEHNTITGCGTGILLDHTYQTAGIKITANTIFNCRDPQLAMQDYGIRNSPGAVAPYYWPGYNSVFEGNILYSLSADSWSLYQKHDYSTSFSGTYGLVDYGTFKSNHYFNPFNSIAVEQYIRYDVTGNPPLSNYIGIDDRAIPWSLNGWRTMAQHGDPTGVGHPLRLPGYRLDPGTPPVAVGFHTDECSAMYPWNATAGPFTGNGADGSYLSFANLDYMERWGAGLGSLTPIVTGSAISPPGTYRFHVRMRSANTDALQLGPIFDTQTNTMPLPHAHFALTPGWGEEDLILEIPEGYDMVTAFQNVHRAYGAISASDVDIDYVRVDRVALDPTYADEIALHHILRYNCPIADPTDQNVGTSFNVPGDPGECWSDVHGNFYAAGDQIPLDEWASIILFRMDVDAANLVLDGNGEHHITANTTWTDHMNVEGSVVVDDGATLTIDGVHIGFAASTQSLTTNITVQPGGTLVLKNGATLRNWMGCGSAPEMWDGVKVLGVSDAYEHAPEQGRVLMESGARITNAKCGILAGFGEVDDPTTVGFDDTNYWVGGSVALRHATFENNVYDVVLHPGGWPATAPYNPENANYQGLALFENCTFRTTRALNNPSLYPKAHVRLTGRDASVFRSCTFANERTDIPSLTSAQLGHGIEAFNSSFTVVSCLPNCADGDVPPNTFRNLDHGIHSTTSWGSLYNIARNCRFKDNVCGVFIDGETGLALRDNAVELGRWHGIDMPTMDELYWLNHHRGLFTTRSWGLNIQDNTLARSPGTPGSALLEGIVVGYSEDHNEVVYRNTASNLTMGFVGEGISADVNGGNPNTIGLQFQCNTNAQNATNLMSRKANGDQDFEFLHTIRGIQGNPNLAAGNSFDQNTVWDFAKNTTQVPIITYYYDAAFADQVLVNHPADVAPLTITGNANACGTGPGGLVPGGGLVTVAVLKPILSTSKYEYGTLRYQYEQLIDGGNTDEVVGEIIAAWPQDIWDLRAYLLGHSPYLSVDALKELINKQGVPVAIKLEVCVANPEATQKEGFLKWAELEALYPLPAYALAAIEASWDTKTFRFALEAQMAGKHTRMTQAANHLLELFAADSVRSHPDSLRWVWQQLRTNAARYAETGLLLRQQRYTEAQAVLNAMPAEKELRPKEQSERQRMLSYVGLLATAKADGRDPYRLKANEVQQLETLVGDHYDRPAVWASNLLCAQYKLCRAPYTGGKPEPKSIRLHDYSNTSAALGSQLRIQPNPANNWAAFTYSLPGNSATLQLRIRDASGRVVHTLQAGGEEGQVVWDTRGTAPGDHTVELLREGQVERTERLIVQP